MLAKAVVQQTSHGGLLSPSDANSTHTTQLGLEVDAAC